jgi:competence protein ComEC
VTPAAIAAFTAGILSICALPTLPSAILLCVFVVPALMPWRGRAIYAMAALGALLATWQGGRYLDERWPASRHNEELVLQGHVVSLPELAQGEDGVQTWRFVFQPDRRDLPQRIRTAWYRADQPVRGGDCWRFALRLRTPHGSLNPGGFDYEGWLFRQGITAGATVRDGARCDESGGSALLRARQRLTDDLDRWIPDPTARALIAALTTGDQSGLTDHDWDVFRVTGTSHLVAISGFNIAVIAGFAFFLFRWLWSVSARLCERLPAQRAGMIGSALVAGCYAGIAGFEPPVARAWLMVVVVLVAALTHRSVGVLRVLVLAWFAILVADPFAVLAPGLWLSFGAVAVILFVGTGRLRPPVAWRAAVELQIVLSVALVPLTLYFFQGAAWLGPLVNLVAVPIVTVMTPLLLIALLLAAIVPVIGIPALALCGAALIKLRLALEWAATSLPHVWIPASPPIAALMLALLGIVLLIAPRGLPTRMLGALCLVPMLLPRGPEIPSGLRVAVLDVGQGLSIVAQTPHHALLFDAGPAFQDGFDAGQSVVAPYLLHEGVRRLDVLMLSHPDNDHGGGVPAVRRLMNVEREIGTDRGEPCRDGMRWEWDGVRFAVLHPDGAQWSGNNRSCVLKIDGPFSALFPGDIEAPAEARLWSDRASALKADLLIAPHHGSKSSSTSEFVRSVMPGVVVFGAGWRNHFGHPRPEVTARYAEIGVKQFATGSSGEITIDGPARITEWRRTHAHFWNASADE